MVTMKNSRADRKMIFYHKSQNRTENVWMTTIFEMYNFNRFKNIGCNGLSNSRGFSFRTDVYLCQLSSNLDNSVTGS